MEDGIGGSGMGLEFVAPKPLSSSTLFVAKTPARSAACRGLCAAPSPGGLCEPHFAQTLSYESKSAQECLFCGRLRQRTRARRPQNDHSAGAIHADILLGWRLLR
jgi:hypothetical protein